jgi:hypothetical protein
MFTPIYFIFELFALVCCAYAYKKLDNNFKIFLPFLVFIVIYEFINIYDIKLLLWHHSNAWCNNLESFIELIVYGQFMASLDARKNYKTRIYIATTIGVIITFIDIFFIHGLWNLATVAMVAQSIMLTCMACVYLYNLFNYSDEYPDLLRFPPFLIAIALLFYSSVNYFFFAPFDNLLAKYNAHLFGIAYLAHEIGIIFLYTFLGLAFLCFLRAKKLSG